MEESRHYAVDKCFKEYVDWLPQSFTDSKARHLYQYVQLSTLSLDPAAGSAPDWDKPIHRLTFPHSHSPWTPQ